MRSSQLSGVLSRDAFTLALEGFGIKCEVAFEGCLK